MEFLEYYSGGLALTHPATFEKAGHPVVFRLFPTIHIGDPAYYASLLRTPRRTATGSFTSTSRRSTSGPNDH